MEDQYDIRDLKLIFHHFLSDPGPRWWRCCAGAFLSHLSIQMLAPAYQLLAQDQLAPAHQLSALVHSQVTAGQSCQTCILFLSERLSALYRTAIVIVVFCSLRKALE